MANMGPTPGKHYKPTKITGYQSVHEMASSLPFWQSNNGWPLKFRRNYGKRSI